MANQVSCVECDAAVQLEDNLEVGEIVTCGECSAELEVTGVEPATVAMAPEVEEDWGE